MIKHLPVARPYFFGKEHEYIDQALHSMQISGAGAFVDRMEDLIAKAAATPHAIVVSSGTAALDLAFEALGVKPGDEVIVPDFTMFAPVAALLRRGAVVVPVDIDATWNLDPGRVAEALTARTKGILMVHTYGHPADATRICELARQRGIWVVEDAAEALGAKLGGRAVGSFGNVATFSFYANKVVTSGEGGAVVTRDSRLAARLRALRNLCFGDGWAQRFVHDGIGFNFRLSNVLAAIGCAQLEHLDTALASKRRTAVYYRERLSRIRGLILPPDSSRVLHSYWVFGVLLPHGHDRSEVAARLAEAGIDTRPFFHPVHSQPCVPAMQGAFPNSDMLAERGIYLPSFVGISKQDIDRVSDALKKALAA
ncbi:MAG: DegT/DnrJ/EryC1/StrS family aminotransferase [Alphaproteobacteria bacterium]|nr:DegT/DnrJ/EryC1/StrS family aminotransferase [Alphaproteobacteria bacterium]